MAKTWNSYFDETDIEDWGSIPFHESWAHNYKNDYEKLSYDKATDSFFKSLRAIANKSTDIEKVRKAVFLMAQEYTFRWYSDNLLAQKKENKDYLRKYWDLVQVQIGSGNNITHKRSFEQPEENQAKKRKMTDLESEGNKLPDDARKWSPDHVKKFLESRMNGSDFNNDDIKKIRKQDLTGKAFFRLTEEKLTRIPGLYELKPSPAEEIMELIEELKEKLVKEEASPAFVSATEFKKFREQNKKELEQIRSDIYTINSKIKIVEI
ncbi:3114_t:CDS:2, partial [Funneliformis geosporum]